VQTEGADVAVPDPYLNWSGAPKHWVDVPAQRRHPHSPEQLGDDPFHVCSGDGASSRGEWSVAAVALAVAVAAFILIGAGSSASESDPPPAERTTSVP
jgi:hypothetical protein